MDCTIEEYIVDAKNQLVCNASQEYLEKYYTYTYTNEEVDANIDYFQKCLNDGLSAYKALLYFHDYLQDKTNENNQRHSR